MSADCQVCGFDLPYEGDCTVCGDNERWAAREAARIRVSNKYRTIVADPPWPILGKGDGKSRVRPPYPLMQVEQMQLPPVVGMAEDDAHLYLWTTQQFVCEAQSVARAWGFVPRNLIVWCKPGLGAGARFRPTTEFVWFCERGYDSLPIKRRDVGTWFQWPRGKHSEKPDAFYDLVESISPGPYVELFSRRERMGWDSWGDESANTAEMSHRIRMDEEWAEEVTRRQLQEVRERGGIEKVMADLASEPDDPPERLA